MPIRRRTFFSFHYRPDNWRAAEVRSMGVVEGNPAASDNDWESITQGGDAAIKRWIDGQMTGKSCVIVLIGSQTSGRKWIKYEIDKAWNDGRGLLGIYIHGLKDRNGNQSTQGANPFYSYTVNGKRLSNIVKAYEPPYLSSRYVYAHIKDNIADWIEEAISIRNTY